MKSGLNYLSDMAKPVFIKWEKLRIPYNLFLLAVLLTLYLLGKPTSNISTLLFLLHCLIGGVLANFCFLAGPMFETYVLWLGWRSAWVTALLFIGGLLVSVPLVLLYAWMSPFAINIWFN